MSRTLTVNGYSQGWLSKGFPWVYPKEVVRGGARPGEEVVLHDGRGRVLGRGLADVGFLAARVFRHDEGPLDTAWLHARLDQARALRRAVVDPETSGFRLVHAENDGLPGIRIDHWGDWVGLVLDSEALLPLVDGMVAWVEQRLSPTGITLSYRSDPRDSRDLPPPQQLTGPPAPDEIEVTERGLRYGVRPLQGPDVGVYADMREVRAWLEPHWTGTRLLNLFAYTAAFSVSAAAHGATQATSVDLSGPSLERARDNVVRNGLDLDAHDFVTDDVFKALDRYRRKGVRFDRVVVDPPSFSRGKATWSAKKDWPRLVAACVRVLDTGGWLIVASNQGELSPRAFDGFVADGVRKAGARAQQLLATGQGPDFPAGSWFPEGRYLKVRVLRVLRDDA